MVEQSPEIRKCFLSVNEDKAQRILASYNSQHKEINCFLLTVNFYPTCCKLVAFHLSTYIMKVVTCGLEEGIRISYLYNFSLGKGNQHRSIHTVLDV